MHDGPPDLICIKVYIWYNEFVMAIPPTGEGIQPSGDVDFGLRLPAPTYELIKPKTAPAELLAAVSVNSEGQCLEAATPLGNVSLEVYWKADEEPDSVETRGDFFAALSPQLDPDAATNPLATHNFPYTTLPDGALYELVVRTPLEAVEHDWSEERSANVEGPFSYGGTSLHEFRRRFPGVEVDLPEGRYTITATERTRPTLVVAARVEDGEPLTRVQTVTGTSVHYKETLAGGFQQSGLEPETAITIINSRTTIRGEGEEADRQRLEFKEHDGFQRTGPEAEKNSGLVELVLVQATEVELSGFTFTPEKAYTSPPFEDYGGLAMRGGGMMGGRKDVTMGGDGLLGGETRYRPPETIKVSMGCVRDLQPIAAFRFALAGADEALAA